MCYLLPLIDLHIQDKVSNKHKKWYKSVNIADNDLAFGVVFPESHPQQKL